MAEPSAAPSIGVVVVSYGDPGLLEENVLAADLTGVPAVLVVVDNCSTPAARRAVETLCEGRGLELVALPTNAGFGAGANAGARRAVELGCTTLLFLNPDAVVEGDVVRALDAQVRARPRSMVAPTVVRPDGSTWFAGAELSLVTGRTRRRGVLQGRELQPWLTGACFAVGVELWQELGGFDDRYFLYWEDVDLSARCLAAGGELVVREDLSVVHAVGGTQQPEGKSAVYYAYNCRNRLLFAAAHLGLRRTVRWVLTSPSYAREVVSRGGPHAWSRDRTPLWAALSGTASGAAVAAPALLRAASARPRASRTSDRSE